MSYKIRPVSGYYKSQGSGERWIRSEVQRKNRK